MSRNIVIVMPYMDRFGDDLLLSIFDRIHKQDDRNSFSQVSKRFWKISCVRYQLRLYIMFPEFLDYILPAAASPNLKTFECHKPLSNHHMKLLAHSCPNLRCLDISLNGPYFDDPHDQAANFDDDGLCAVSNACMHLSSVYLNRRLHVSDVGVASLIVRSNSLTLLDLSRCVKVTDESLKAIGESSRLESLSLVGCHLITDLGLEYLAKGKVRNCLWQLSLAECERITDDGIIFLKRMRCLVDLNLSKCGTNVTDRGVQAAVSQIPGIRVLYLSWLNKVTDVSMIVIAKKCWNLRYICLMGCEGVTGKGLLAFANHNSLESIELFSCHNISTKDVESFIFSRRRKIYPLLKSRIYMKSMMQIFMMIILIRPATTLRTVWGSMIRWTLCLDGKEADHVKKLLISVSLSI